MFYAIIFCLSHIRHLIFYLSTLTIGPHIFSMFSSLGPHLMGPRPLVPAAKALTSSCCTTLENLRVSWLPSIPSHRSLGPCQHLRSFTEGLSLLGLPQK